MSTPGYQQALGKKIAAERRRRGLSQPELARLVGRSVAWVSQVERGVRRIDRMSVLESLSGALDIPLAELAAEAPIVAAVTEESPAAGDLRLVLSGVHSLKAMLNGHQAPGVDDLLARTDRAWQLTHAARYADLADLLRALIPDLESAARAVPEDQRSVVFEMMTAAYSACSAALDKLGEPEAAWIAANRAMASAERAGKPLLVAAGAFRLVFVFLSARHYAQADETARTAADALWHLADDGSQEAMSLWGALTLQRAITAARTGDAEAAYVHLERAADMATRLGLGRNDFATEFGPANVAVFEVAVAVELSDAGRALRAAESVDVSVLSPERHARMLIDVARAHAQRRQPEQAVTALREAEDMAAELVRSHYLARQITADLLSMQDPPGPELHALSVRLGVTKLCG